MGSRKTFQLANPVASRGVARISRRGGSNENGWSTILTLPKFKTFGVWASVRANIGCVQRTCLSLPRNLCLGGNWCSSTPVQTDRHTRTQTHTLQLLAVKLVYKSVTENALKIRIKVWMLGTKLSMACCECLNCTGGKVDIPSAAPLSLPSQELNINHMRWKKVVLIKL